MLNVDILIIGGGAAGMSAAVSAKENGIDNILIVERTSYLGGVLRQCIHNGFGIHRFNEDLTGVEFAKRYGDMVESMGIPYMLETFVLDIDSDKVVMAMNPTQGIIEIKAKAIILAMGCRERTRNALLIPGIRSAGVITAGTAQKYLNIDGYLPGKNVVILGSGDIGLIMARQFMIEGVRIQAVVELMPYSSGLARNIKQCIEDFNIPVYYNSTVTDIRGRDRVSSVCVCKVDEQRRPKPETKREIPCDTLMISAGLIPENELTEQANIKMCATTKGAAVTEDLQTSVAGIFACGNVLHVHDLVDFVSMEGQQAGINAAKYVRVLLTPTDNKQQITVIQGYGVTGVVPQSVKRYGYTEKIKFMFRPNNKFKNVSVCIKAEADLLRKKAARILTPGEMAEISIDRKAIPEQCKNIEICVEV